MARRTGQDKDQIIAVIYGINPNRCQVDRVSVTRGGTLIRAGHTHVIRPNETAQSETKAVFQITDLLETQADHQDDEVTRQRIATLEAKAERMRVDRDRLGTDGTP